MRYTGPKAKIMRRFGEVLSSSPKYQRILERRKHPPGQHGARRKPAVGAYGKRLLEKQKLKAIYDLSEAQLVRYMKEATRRPGPSGANLLQLLETRLETVVYRLGFAPTTWAARQLIGHGHVRINGRRVNIPSYLVRPGEKIAVSGKMRENALVVDSVTSRPPDLIPRYLQVNRDEVSGELVRLPNREEVPVNIDETLIVEFYAR
jgi:small subunit ribosomal protein S4